jgi:hypothetical protein
MSIDTRLRRDIQGLFQAVEPSPAPLDGIIRRGKSIRLRRAGAVAGAMAVAVAAVIAGTAAQAPHGGQHTVPPSAAAAPGAAGAVFARGVADGHAWRLAVQNIADPGYTCLLAVTINGTDADPLYLQSGGAAVTLGPADPGVGFAFLQLPADIREVSVNGTIVQPVTVTACGGQYRLAGFAYPLTGMLRITAMLASGGRQALLTVPAATTVLQPTAAASQVYGIWDNKGSAPGLTDEATVASGTIDGQDWAIRLQFGAAGDCYEFSGTSSLDSSQTGYCGPISTLDGPETIMALPLAFPDRGTGATGYAVQVSPATSGLRATLSNGSSEMAAFCVLDGRTYAAFIVPNPLRLSRLTWLDSRGRVIASTSALPRYGYVQFQP